MLAVHVAIDAAVFIGLEARVASVLSLNVSSAIGFAAATSTASTASATAAGAGLPDDVVRAVAAVRGSVGGRSEAQPRARDEVGAARVGKGICQRDAVGWIPDTQPWDGPHDGAVLAGVKRPHDAPRVGSGREGVGGRVPRPVTVGNGGSGVAGLDEVIVVRVGIAQ